MKRALWSCAALALLACTPKAPAAPKAAAPTGILTLVGAPAGSVLIIDESLEYPLGRKQRFALDAGPHRLTIEHDDYFPAYHLVEVVATQETTLTLQLRPLVF